MDKLRILVTGGGSPGIMGTLYSLQGHYVVCTDVKKNVPGQLADKFYQIAPAKGPHYIYQVGYICDLESIDVILPQNTAELDILAHEAPRPCAVNRNIGKDISEGSVVRNRRDMLEFARYGKFVVKPLNMSGGRGVRIVTNGERDFYRKPSIPIVTFRELMDELGKEFKMWAMPYYEGTEVTVDCFYGKKGFTAIPRTRDEIRSGISFSGRVVKDIDLIDKCWELTEELGLRYAYGFQFIGGKVIECNPRVQGTMVISTLAGANMIEAACYEALGLEYPPFDINWDLDFTRYWGMIANKERI